MDSMQYCNVKRCGKYKSCKNHVTNIITDDLISIKDFSISECTEENNYSLYESIICKKCGRPERKIFANDMCKYCYNKTSFQDGKWEVKSYYKPVENPKKKGREPDWEKINKIISLRNEGLSFREIAEHVGKSLGCTQNTYYKYKDKV